MVMIAAAAICFCILLIGGVGLYFYLNSEETPQTTTPESEKKQKSETGTTTPGTGTSGTGTTTPGTKTSSGTGTTTPGTKTSSGTETTTPVTVTESTCEKHLSNAKNNSGGLKWYALAATDPNCKGAWGTITNQSSKEDAEKKSIEWCQKYTSQPNTCTVQKVEQLPESVCDIRLSEAKNNTGQLQWYAIASTDSKCNGAWGSIAAQPSKQAAEQKSIEWCIKYASQPDTCKVQKVEQKD